MYEGIKELHFENQRLSEAVQSLQRQLAEAKEQAEELSAALNDIGHVVAFDKDWLELTGEQREKICKIIYAEYHETGIIAAHDSRVRAETLREAKAIAIGCHDYGGGYRDEASRKIFHHGMDTVANVIQATIDNPNDPQALTVLAIGKRAERDEMTPDNYSTDAIHTPRDADDKVYPCMACGTLRSQNEGGTTFTVCDECWDKYHPKSK